jgi:hypothetical protein
MTNCQTVDNLPKVPSAAWALVDVAGTAFNIAPVTTKQA